MTLAVPPVAASARATDVAAAGGLVAAETQPPVTRTPAKAAMASTETNPFLSMANLLLRNDGFAATAGRRQWAVSGGRLAQFTLALAGECLHHVWVHGPHLVIPVARRRSSLGTGSARDAMSRRLPQASSESAFAGGIFRSRPLARRCYQRDRRGVPC